ncbi:MAG: polysaccharide deacetylase family protein [Candidatus Cloacimonadota bacterium]|nr:MAG: polysaccharide deacetylase family protein [Candidatus Cloacimonadota bacterium]
MGGFKNIPVLAYHKVIRNFEWGVTWVLPSQFLEQMRFLYQREYNVATLSDSLKDKDSGRKVVITFDDAYKDLINNAFSIMQEFSFKATVFVVTDFVGKKNLWDVNFGFRKFLHMDWSDLRYLCSAGFEIGSHTQSHPDLTKISLKKVRGELFSSKKILEDKLGVSVQFVSYPFGRYSGEIKQIARECGYSGGVCLSHPFKVEDDIFEIEREGVYIFDTIDNFKAKLSLYGKWAVLFEKTKGRTVNFFAGATYIIKRFQKSFQCRE